MNKLFKILSSTALGVALAVGVGVGVAQSGNAGEVGASEAVDTTYDLSNSVPSTLTSSESLSKDSNGRGMGKSGATYTLTTSKSFTNVSKIVVNAASNYSSYNKHSVSATVGGVSFGSAVNFSAKASTDYTISSTKADGVVVVSLNNSAVGTTKTNSIWVKTITVYTDNPATLDSISLGGTYATNFYVGDTFTHEGQIVTAKYSDKSEQDVTASAEWSSPDMTTTGEKTVTVSYTESSVTKDTQYNINVYPAGTYYTVTDSIIGGHLSSTTQIEENNPLDVSVVPDEHFSVPSSVTVTMGGTELVEGEDYLYSTGELYIEAVTGDVVVSGSCIEDTKYSVTYVKGAHGTGTDHVVSNIYSGSSHSLLAFADTGLTAETGYAFSKWSIDGTEYSAGESVTITSNITATAIYSLIPVYKLVTDASLLSVGDTIVIAGTNDNVTKALSTTQNSNNRGSIVVTLSNDSFEYVDGVQEITLGKSNGNWTFYVTSSSATGYLCAASSSSNYLRTQEENDSEGQWSISIDNNIVTCLAQGNNTRNKMRYNSSSVNGIFACYASNSSTGVGISFYKKVTEIGRYTDAFLSAGLCDNGVTAPDTAKWNTLSTSYSDLSAACKLELQTATANEDGTCAERTVARYDYILGKYGTTSYSNFMGRTVTPAGSASVLSTMNVDNNIVIIVVISVVSLTALGGYFFIRRRKETH